MWLHYQELRLNQEAAAVEQYLPAFGHEFGTATSTVTI